MDTKAIDQLEKDLPQIKPLLDVVKEIYESLRLGRAEKSNPGGKDSAPHGLADLIVRCLLCHDMMQVVQAPKALRAYCGDCGSSIFFPVRMTKEELAQRLETNRRS